ncbi:unnamed protein product, partial [Durusdinium trenchii]
MQDELRKVELLAWVAHLRYMNWLCSDPFVQSVTLSCFGAELGASPSLKSVLRHFAVEVSESNLALPRLLTACSAARLGQGDPLDVAVCFAALCRALNIRARLVRSFWLGPAQGASIAAQQLEKPSQQLWQRLTKGGLSDEKALSIALEIEATGSCVAETSLLAYAGAVHKRDEKNCANITCWVECFD